MRPLATNEIIQLFVSLAVLLAVSRQLGELARKLAFPSVLGELLAGIALGPTLFGHLWPQLTSYIAPNDGSVKAFFAGFNQLSVALLLFVAGLEINLTSLAQKKKAALGVSVMGIALPFFLGFTVAWFWPSLVGHAPPTSQLVFALFFATALSISALPVIAKTLMDLGLYRSDIGTVTMAAAVVDDLAGWMIFAVVLGMATTNGQQPHIGRTIVLTVGFSIVMLALCRKAARPILKYFKNHSERTLSFCLCVALFSAALTELIGAHALFGAFMAGAALGDTEELNQKTREGVKSFVASFFAPIFFAGIGLKINFAQNFDLLLVAFVILISCFGKIIGCSVAARLGGMSLRRSLAVGVCMNARGAMEIILGALALQHGLIGVQLFVALVVMAVVTSLMVGPAIKGLRL